MSGYIHGLEKLFTRSSSLPCRVSSPDLHVTLCARAHSLTSGPAAVRMWTPGNLPAWKAMIFLCNIISAAVAKRHIVYWNSTNTRLTAGELSVQVNLNDYLDIYCPHYPNKGAVGDGQPETLALYLVAEASFQGCVETRRAIKRWECNTPYAPFGPVRFSEKIQRFTPFSLGFEFLPGRHYYYSSLPTDEGPPLPCMKLRVTVCCEPTSEGSKQIQGSAPSSRASSLRTASPPLLLLLIFLLLIT
ncbi:ephrin-A4 [Halichoeres trimaculatus]|uniref:ephrin-A4 n=1 Tax=Halichoeres trimaculatus TaxID=147232 RepID=UPI003D9F4222